MVSFTVLKSWVICLSRGNGTIERSDQFWEIFLESQNGGRGEGCEESNKKTEGTYRDRLEFTYLVEQTIRRLVRPDDLFVFLCENPHRFFRPKI